MSEFKQIEPLEVGTLHAIVTGKVVRVYEMHDEPSNGPALYFDSQELTAFVPWASGALGLPDVAELQRRVEKLEAQLEERKEAVDAVAAALQDALTQRNATVSIIARDIIETAPESLMDAVDAAAPALRALVDAARERQEKS